VGEGDDEEGGRGCIGCMSLGLALLHANKAANNLDPNYAK
jgi:hypothetical protein